MHDPFVRLASWFYGVRNGPLFSSQSVSGCYPSFSKIQDIKFLRSCLPSITQLFVSLGSPVPGTCNKEASFPLLFATGQPNLMVEPLDHLPRFPCLETVDVLGHETAITVFVFDVLTLCSPSSIAFELSPR
ncbi:MAG: hypothetical protein J3Q66DRAFT_369973 [Benniella sp.]|nr:MAG: hypothetical protein J3Q66DRAFT_369973 [Benniella sp.]